MEEISALQSQYEQRIAKLESELRGAQEAKESLEATYRQLKQDKTQNVWKVEHCYDFHTAHSSSFYFFFFFFFFTYYRIG